MSTPTTQAKDQANASDERNDQISKFKTTCITGAILAVVCSYNIHYAMAAADEACVCETLSAFCQWRATFTAIIVFLELYLYFMAIRYDREWSGNITVVCIANLITVILAGFIHFIMTRSEKESILTNCTERFDTTDKLYHPYYPYAFFFWHSDVVKTHAEAAEWCGSTWNSSIFWDIMLYLLSIDLARRQVKVSANLEEPEVDAGRGVTNPPRYNDDSGLLCVRTTMSIQTLKDITAGTAGGICQVLVGQPFDIVKVRMQTAPKGTYKGMLDCAGGIMKNEGPLAFYKGTLTPLLGIGVCVSIQFGVIEWMKRFYAEQNIKNGLGGPSGLNLTGSQLVVSGVAAGLANGVVSGPVEHIRIRLQTQPAKNPPYAGPYDAIKKIFSSHGIQGIYKGQAVTLLREATGYGVYFLAYEKLVQREMATKGIKRDQISPMNAVLYGAAAGYALWAVIYPIDMIKSRMQTDGFTPSTGQKYSSTWNCVSTVWRTEGIKAFTRGLGPTLIRSPFANGATFLGFEMAIRVLGTSS